MSVGPTQRGKGCKLMVLAAGTGLPLGVLLASASPAEVTLLAATIDRAPWKLLARQPARLIADRGYAAHPVRAELAACGIEPILPARRTHRKATHQDRRKLRRYQKRRQIERPNAWLQNYRRVLTRFEYHAPNPRAFVHLACALLVLKRVLG